MSVKPILLSASRYVGIKLIKMLSSDIMSDMHLALDFGTSFRNTIVWVTQHPYYQHTTKAFYI